MLREALAPEDVVRFVGRSHVQHRGHMVEIAWANWELMVNSDEFIVVNRGQSGDASPCVVYLAATLALATRGRASAADPPKSFTLLVFHVFGVGGWEERG